MTARETTPGTSGDSLPVVPVLVTAAVLAILLGSLADLPTEISPLSATWATVAVIAAVGGSALAAFPLQRSVGRYAIAATLCGVVAARVLLQIAPNPITLTVTLMISVAAMTILLPHLTSAPFGPDALASATLIGFALATGFRLLGTGAPDWAWVGPAWLDPALLIPLLVILPGIVAMNSEPPDWRLRPPTWTWTLMLLPPILLWASPTVVAAASGLSDAWVSLVMIGAIGLAMFVLPLRAARWDGRVTVGVLIVTAASLPWLTGWAVLALAAAGTIVTPLLVRGATLSWMADSLRSGRYTVIAAAAWAAMVGLLLLTDWSQTRGWSIIADSVPVVAIALACAPLLSRAASRPTDYRYATPSPLHVPALVLTGVVAVLVAWGHAGGVLAA